jgi:hypothetical protein
MASVPALSEVDHGFEPKSGQTKDYIIGICCLSANHPATVTSKNKNWLAWNQDNVSKLSDILTRGLLCQVDTQNVAL